MAGISIGARLHPEELSAGIIPINTEFEIIVQKFSDPNSPFKQYDPLHLDLDPPEFYPGSGIYIGQGGPGAVEFLNEFTQNFNASDTVKFTGDILIIRARATRGGDVGIIIHDVGLPKRNPAYLRDPLFKPLIKDIQFKVVVIVAPVPEADRGTRCSAESLRPPDPGRFVNWHRNVQFDVLFALPTNRQELVEAVRKVLARHNVNWK